MPTYRDQAIVLRTYDLGEADRILVLLTRDHGKLRAVARGIRRTSSRFAGLLEPANHVDAQLAIGRGSLDVVAQIQGMHTFDLASNYPRFTAGQVLLEAAERVVVEDRVPAALQFRLLLRALIALDAGVLPGNLVVDSYLLRALATAGYAIALDRCASCNRELAEGWFSPNNGGVVCEACRPTGASVVDGETLSYLGALLAGDWQSTQVAPALGLRVSKMIATFAQWQLDKGLRSLEFLVRQGYSSSARIFEATR